MDEIENAKHVIDIWQLGQTSAKHETGGRGSATISTGLGDHGGVSYGAYQLSTKMGTVQKFVNWTRHFDEQRGHIMFTASWPPGPFAEVDVKVPSPEPHQSIERIQHYDQSQAQMMSEIRAQNAQIEAQAQQGLGLGGPMR
jgi:hypothetical protein